MDAQLAQWFDEHIRAPEPRRGCARASRRQATSPDIPRPGLLRPRQLAKRADLRGSAGHFRIDGHPLLGKALGAIASYALSRDVPAARVVVLERTPDFPAEGPILIITDACCDIVRVRREHAFLVPVALHTEGSELPRTVVRASTYGDP